MYSTLTRNAAIYSKMGLESEVMAANPHKLITLLLEGAQESVSQARKYMLEKNYEAKSNAISKAIAIITEGLKDSLDLRKGGEIAINLYSLYSYTSGRLLLANLRNETEHLDEVSALLGEILDAWVQIDPANNRQTQSSPSSSVSIAA